MSALTNLFTSMANKIRSKTGTATTYTPAEMVSDGIDDVFDAGVASATTPITPSNSSPASMTSGTGYKPTANGYAISSYREITPSPWQSGTPISSGDIIRFTGDGYAVPEDEEIAPRDVEAPRLDGRTHYFVASQDGGYAVENQPVVIHPSDSHAVFLERGLNYNIIYSDGYAIESQPTTLTPSDSSPASISSGGMYRAGGAGYAIETQPTNITPSSSPASVASGDIVKIGGSGVIVDALPTPTSITPDDGTPVQMTTGNLYSVSRNGYAIQNQPTSITPANGTIPSITSGTIYQAGGNGYAIQSYNSVQPTYDTDYDLAIGSIAKNTGAYVGKIIRSRGNATPSDSNPQYLSTGYYKVTDTGYLYKTQQGGGTLKTLQIKNGTTNFSSRVQYSVDIKSLLPNDYTNLSLNNFSIDASIFGFQASTSSVTNDTALLLSYDSSIGILYLGRKTGRQSIGGTNYYLSLNYYILVNYV